MLTRAPEGLPPIVQTAERQRVSIEEAVRGLGESLPWLSPCAQPSVAQIRSRRICPRYHKLYGVQAFTRRSGLGREDINVGKPSRGSWLLHIIRTYAKLVFSPLSPRGRGLGRGSCGISKNRCLCRLSYPLPNPPPSRGRGLNPLAA